MAFEWFEEYKQSDETNNVKVFTFPNGYIAQVIADGFINEEQVYSVDLFNGLTHAPINFRILNNTEHSVNNFLREVRKLKPIKAEEVEPSKSMSILIYIYALCTIVNLALLAISIFG